MYINNGRDLDKDGKWILKLKQKYDFWSIFMIIFQCKV